MTSPASFDGRRVVVMGLGRFGGGIGVTRWLARQGARVVVTDLASAADLASSVAALDGLNIEMRLGGHDDRDLAGADLLVVSPAVNKTTSAFFQRARDRGIPWSSEMNLFLERCPAKVVGITGSVGKSTTTAMVGEILSATQGQPDWKHGRVWLGGNIGKSLLDDLPAMRPADVVVLELSSFQLEDAAALQWSAHYALITNIRENHLDRHGTMRAYAEAKANIYRWQKPGDVLALPDEGATEELPDGWQQHQPLYRYAIDRAARSVKIDKYNCREGRSLRFHKVPLAVPGAHNLRNAAAALTLAAMLDADLASGLEALQSFRGLVHRLEFVRELGGVRYFNDSKATTPEAAITAIEAFEGPVVAIVGGSEKGSSYGAFGATLARRAKAVVCLGATREKIAAEVRRAHSGSDDSAAAALLESSGTRIFPTAVLAPAAGPILKMADDFETAVTTARELARAGDVVVLTPGCPSYDMFKNYEQRGDSFKQIVRGWR